MNSQDIRATFLKFFEDKKHSIVPSAPMVLKDDPTLMFVNSGMAPFKEYFFNGVYRFCGFGTIQFYIAQNTTKIKI